MRLIVLILAMNIYEGLIILAGKPFELTSDKQWVVLGFVIYAIVFDVLSLRRNYKNDLNSRNQKSENSTTQPGD